MLDSVLCKYEEALTRALSSTRISPCWRNPVEINWKITWAKLDPVLFSNVAAAQHVCWLASLLIDVHRVRVRRSFPSSLSLSKANVRSPTGPTARRRWSWHETKWHSSMYFNFRGFWRTIQRAQSTYRWILTQENLFWADSKMSESCLSCTYCTLMVVTHNILEHRSLPRPFPPSKECQKPPSPHSVFKRGCVQHR